ncbi:MAG TPA: hypothetical protein VGF01_06810, partial [Terracidiphilus sp.]
PDSLHQRGRCAHSAPEKKDNYQQPEDSPSFAARNALKRNWHGPGGPATADHEVGVSLMHGASAPPMGE